jgi:hypothetical protein
MRKAHFYDEYKETYTYHFYLPIFMNIAFSIFIKSEQARRALLKKLEKFGYIYLKF